MLFNCKLISSMSELSLSLHKILPSARPLTRLPKLKDVTFVRIELLAGLIDFQAREGTGFTALKIGALTSLD